MVTMKQFVDKDLRITFKGDDFLMLSGAICTQEQWDDLDISYAHLMEDGSVKRFGRKIGTVDDIVVLGEYSD